jgi:putative oxidoreductase
MQIVKQIPAYLLAAVFFVFGLEYFLHFMPKQPELTGDALTYFGLMNGSGYLRFVKVLEVVIGLLIFIPKTRALGLILIAPITVNILCFELFIAKQPGIGIALVVINLIALVVYKDKYKSIFQ